MVEALSAWDEQLFLILNGLGHPYLDSLMIWLSDKYIWFPFYAYLIFLLFKKEGIQFWIPLLLIILTIVMTDQFTSSFMKPFFERWRPCKDPDLQGLVVIVNKCRGKYGFASSHAANTMGLAFFYFQWLGKKTYPRLGAHSMVSAGRILTNLPGCSFSGRCACWVPVGNAFRKHHLLGLSEDCSG